MTSTWSDASNQYEVDSVAVSAISDEAERFDLADACEFAAMAGFR